MAVPGADARARSRRGRWLLPALWALAWAGPLPVLAQAGQWQALYQQALSAHAAQAYGPAQAAARQALELARRQPQGQQPYVASSLNLLGQIEQDQGHHAAAADLLAQALALSEASLGAHANTASMAWNLGNALTALGREREALPHYRRSLEIAQDRAADAGMAALREQSLRALARLHSALGEHAQAQAYLQPLPQAGGAPMQWRLLLAQAAQHSRQGEADLAEPLLRRALALQGAVDPADPALAEPLNELGLWHAGRKEYAQAAALFAQAQQITEAHAPDDPALARLLASRARMAQALRQDEQARALHAQALARYGRETGTEALIGQADALNGLASLLYQKRRFKEAEPGFLQALERMELAVGRDDARLLPLLDNLAALHRSQARAGESVHARRAAALREAGRLAAAALPASAAP